MQREMSIFDHDFKFSKSFSILKSTYLCWAGICQHLDHSFSDLCNFWRFQMPFSSDFVGPRSRGLAILETEVSVMITALKKTSGWNRYIFLHVASSKILIYIGKSKNMLFLFKGVNQPLPHIQRYFNHSSSLKRHWLNGVIWSKL